MANVIEMPKLSDTMDAGTLVAWKKQEGDQVEPGEVLAEVESDKATMELEAFDGGILRKLLVGPGDSVPVGAPMAVVSEEDDEDIDGLVKELRGKLSGGNGATEAKEEETPSAADEKIEEMKQAQEATPEPSQSKPSKPEPAKPEPAAEPQAEEPEGDGRIMASPVAARMAQDAGLDLRLIKGTGPGGRIVKRDIEKAKEGGMASTAPMGMIPKSSTAGLQHPEQEYEDLPVSNMRRTIAHRLSDSKSQIPHYYVTVEINMSQAIELRKQLNALEGVKVSVNDFVVKAASLALEKNPMANASFHGDHIRVYHRVDIGMAVAIEDGLITPVVRGVNHLGLKEISVQARELVQKARDRKLKTEEFTGSTFTVSNLGMMGVKHFTAVINPPEAAIMAVGATREVPVIKDGELEVAQIMDVTLSSDHRVLDGAQSAQFLQDFKYFLENPITFAL